MAAATFSTAGRRLLSTAATAAEKTELPVPIARLRQLARAGRLDDIDATLAPLFPSHPVAALSALSSVGLPDRASALLGTITSPTTAHLNAVLSPLLRRRRLAGLQRLPHRAEELWRAMVQDHGIAPDTAAYNARITYKSANGTVEEVKELIRVMREEAGLRPDLVSYNALMRAMARHNRVDETVEVYRSLEAGEEADVALDCATYTCVVGALCGAGRWSEAEDVFYAGVKRRKVTDLGTVRVLVRGLKDAGKGRAARRVVVGLRKKFPEQFDGPWRELEEVAGLNSSGKEDDDVEDGADEKPVTRAAAA
ncbi:unnamed protein product [Miscanthus lutarioriparius]|uniref:Pentatricopeptide repeat-containing protein n=1 Tax=Miscanthus lutarioriparius TaxID=422564 RepID=A0A811P1C9_9POAL|nr:unnamed protein product [Miscanthus lutarioriparius]